MPSNVKNFATERFNFIQLLEHILNSTFSFYFVFAVE